MDDDAAEEEEGEEVGDGHEGVHAVGEVPYESQLNDAAYKDGGDVEDTVGDDPAATAQVFNGPFAVVAPTKDGGEGEGEKAEGEQWRAHDGNLLEGGLGQRGSVGEVYVVIGQYAADDDQAGDGTDDDRVPEGAARRHQCLTDGVARLGGSGHDGCRTQTRLIGEQSAGDAVAGGHHDRRADKAAASGLRREG